MNALRAIPIFLLSLCCFFTVYHPKAEGFSPTLRDQASQWQTRLQKDILPYWLETTRDVQYGGFLASDAMDGSRRATEKQLVSQSRLIWGFSLAHRKGYGDKDHDYLAAAQNGYRFLQEHFLDKKNGGYFWTTEIDGTLKQDMKVLYGQVFVVYALVELYRADNDLEVLDQALRLYRNLQEHAHDDEHGGWFEHFEADWTPILDPDAAIIVEKSGHKSANTHLHLMEAYTELYAVTGDSKVKKSLMEEIGRAHV